MRRVLATALVLLSPMAAARATSAELLGWDSTAPDGGWTRFAPRPALAPGFAVEDAASPRPRLRLTGAGCPQVFGGWRRAVSVEAGRSYRFRAEATAANATRLKSEAVCQARWLGPKVAEDVAPEYVADEVGPDGGSLLCDDVLTAPPGAVWLEISLLLQWAPEASLAFGGMSLLPAEPPEARPVRVATLYWRPHGPSTPAANVDAFTALIDRVAASRPDVVLLSEAITSIGTGLSVAEAAQEPRGPAFQTLSAAARRHHTYVVYGAYERAGDLVYNSAFVVGRDGSLAATYRKVQLPVGEVEGGLSPGYVYAPLDLDFGRVGLLICHDTAFDEPARLLTLAGAELLLAPAWGGDLTQIRARAMDNGVWVVTAGYDVPSAIIDPAGEVRAQTWKGSATAPRCT